MQRAVLDLVAELAVEELRHGRFCVETGLIEVLAEHVHEVAPSTAFDDLCGAVGCRFSFVPTLEAEGLLLPVGLVLARPRRDMARVRLTVLHELAHWILGRAGVEHTHADVWCLTLALGAPRPVIRRLRAAGRMSALDLAAESGLPAWAAELRVERAANDNAVT